MLGWFRAWIAAAFALLVWGVTFASTRVLLVDFSALEIMVVRFVIAWAALRLLDGAMWFVRGANYAVGSSSPRVVASCGWRDEWLFAAMGLTGVLLYQFLENCAIYYTNASNVAILVSFGPIVTAVLVRMFTKDRSLSPLVISGSLIAVCGVAIVSLNGVLNFQMRPLGDMMAFGAMVCWGVYSVLINKANDRRIKPLTAMRKAFGWSLVLMIPFVLWGRTASGFYVLDGSFSVNFDWDENAVRFARVQNLVGFGFLGVLASALSFIAWSKACAELGVVRTTICLYLEPIIGVGFATLFLGERPTLMSAIGGTVIVIGVVVANWRMK